jgi:arylsulfatase
MDEATPAKMTTQGMGPEAPNILLIVLDDVGFGSFEAFGGPVPSPGLNKVTSEGLTYNAFHTTALCSPTRAAILTGRNHHRVHMGGIPEIANTFPGYDSAIPPEAATVAEVLLQQGYATSCFGKWHLAPSWEQSPAGPFNHWPTGMGFERFYGIMGAECSQYEPPVYDQTTPISPHVGRANYHLTEDLVDQTLTWVDRVKASSPTKPFFTYFSTPAVHAPHHVAPEWIEKFRGQFDEGWDALREAIYNRQLDLGVIPEGTTLTPRPEGIPAWEDYPERFRPVAARLMETFAGFLAHTDFHIHQMLQGLEDRGLLDNTLVIYLTGDNGASAEGTVHGAWSAPSFQNGRPEDPEWLLQHMDDFGSARCENHYNIGWAWALDAPFQWMKQVASHFGGTRNGLGIRWPKGITGTGLRSQFHHVVDLASTIYDVAGITPPQKVNGLDQLPIDGTSMRYSFDAAEAATTRKTQYFEILGNRAIYHEGFVAACFHGRPPWIRLQGLPFDGDQEDWELYDIRTDFSQAHDVSDAFPEKLEELKALFHEVALDNNVYPLRDPGSPRFGDLAVPHVLGDATEMTYTKAHVRMPEPSVLNLKNCSYKVTATIEVTDLSQGVVVAQGGNMAGWAIYVDSAQVARFHYNYYGHEHTNVAANAALTPGRNVITVEFAYDGGFGAGGDVALFINGELSGVGRIAATVPLVFSMSGETFDVGTDTGSPVGPYPHDFTYDDTIFSVRLERLSEPSAAVKAQVEEGLKRAAFSAH